MRYILVANQKLDEKLKSGDLSGVLYLYSDETNLVGNKMHFVGT